MMDICKTSAIDGGCMECSHAAQREDAVGDDDRADDIAMFIIGVFRMRLCRGHRMQLETALAAFREREAREYAAVPR